MPSLQKNRQDTSSLTHEEVNDSYMKGSLLPLDAQVVLLGCEGAGKTCLTDTFLGKEFHDTPPTEGADQMEISIKTTVNWKLLTNDEKLRDLERQALLETEHFLLNDKPVKPSSSTSSKAIATYTPADSSTSKQNPILPLGRKRSLQDHGGHHSHIDEKLKFITAEEFHQMKAMQEEYDPHKRYVHWWDFAGQQIFQHTHGMFISEEVVCLIVFNAGKSLYEVPDRRYPGDITPGKSAIKVILYWMETISSRVSNISANENSMSLYQPVFILVGTHIDELHTDIAEARKMAFRIVVPALQKEIEGKPFAGHIAGSKYPHIQLFAEGSPSIFFISNKVREQEVISKLKQTIIEAAFTQRQKRPIVYVKMERKFLLLDNQDKLKVINFKQAKEVAESCGLPSNDQQVLEALQYFHKNGLLLYFNQVPGLTDIVILSPQWLAKLLTYVLTTLKCHPVEFPLTDYAKKLKDQGLLEQELLEWSLQQFITDEATKGHKMTEIKGEQIVQLLINFKLMADVTSSSLADTQTRSEEEHLFLVPHLLPPKELLDSKQFNYIFYFHFPGNFIAEVVFNQLVVQCVEWNGQHQYDFRNLSFQKVLLDLGNYQSYQLTPNHDIAAVVLSIARQPDLSKEEESEANSDCIELVNAVNQFTVEAVKQHMMATYGKFPVECYIPCTECGKLHIKYKRTTKNRKILCDNMGTYCDIILYHRMHVNTKTASTETTSTVPGVVATLPSTSASENQSEILNRKPEMFDLTNIVIPKIMSKWEYVAEAFRYDLAIIVSIKENGHGDVKKCCREFFKDWLTTDHGAKIGPKTWLTLLDTLKKVSEISDDVIKDIATEVKQLKCD